MGSPTEVQQMRLDFTIVPRIGRTSERILRWLLFGAVVSVLPLVYTFVDLMMRSETPNLHKIIGNGELLVIVWVLSASAFGELIGSDSDNKVLKIIFGGCTFIIILSAALFLRP
jgi:hypothetical protein